jgi:hypothetical protein
LLGMTSLLPLLRGWEYRGYVLPESGLYTLTRGGTPAETHVQDIGWLLNVGFATDDCYMQLQIDYEGNRGKKLSTKIRPADAVAIGAIAQDPTGWVQRYVQPNPASSLGIYVLVVWSGYGQNATLPYLRNTKVTISLTGDSTQAQAHAQATALGIIVSDPEDFLVSLREVYAIKDLKIPESILRSLKT